MPTAAAASALINTHRHTITPAPASVRSLPLALSWSLQGRVGGKKNWKKTNRHEAITRQPASHTRIDRERTLVSEEEQSRERLLG